MLRLRCQSRKIPCCHGQFHSGFCKRFGKTHPEYFRLQENGKRHIGDPEKDKAPDLRKITSVCNSSGIWDEIYEDAKSYFKGEGPEVRGVLVQRGEKGFEWGAQAKYREYYDIMPNDGMLPCYCEKCQTAYAKAKDPTNYANELIWGRVADIGNRLKAEGVRGTLTMMSYFGSCAEGPIFSCRDVCCSRIVGLHLRYCRCRRVASMGSKAAPLDFKCDTPAGYLAFLPCFVLLFLQPESVRANGGFVLALDGMRTVSNNGASPMRGNPL